MRRGDVWWVNLGERRPVVLLSESPNAEFQAAQIVEPAGIDINGIGLEVTVGSADGLAFEGVVRVVFPSPGAIPCTWLATVTEQELIEPAGSLSESKLEDIEKALRLGGSLPEI